MLRISELLCFDAWVLQSFLREDDLLLNIQVVLKAFIQTKDIKMPEKGSSSTTFKLLYGAHVLSYSAQLFIELSYFPTFPLTLHIKLSLIFPFGSTPVSHRRDGPVEVGQVKKNWHEIPERTVHDKRDEPSLRPISSTPLTRFLAISNHKNACAVVI